MQNTLDQIKQAIEGKINQNGLQDGFGIWQNLIVKPSIAGNASVPERQWFNASNDENNTTVAIRGDNNCSKRSLIYGTLIAAAEAKKQGDQGKCDAILNKLRDGITAFEDFDCGDHAVNQKVQDFRNTNFFGKKDEILDLLNSIGNGTTGVTKLTFMANHDFHDHLGVADSRSLALSALASFAMMKGAYSVIRDNNADLAAMFVEEENLNTDDFTLQKQALDFIITSGEDYVYHIMSLGDAGATDQSIKGFAKYFGLGLTSHQLMRDPQNNLHLYQKDDSIQSTNPQLPTLTLVTGNGHTNLVLNRNQMDIIAGEIAQWRQNSALIPQSIKDSFPDIIVAPQLDLGGINQLHHNDDEIALNLHEQPQAPNIRLVEHGPFYQMITQNGPARNRMISIVADSLAPNYGSNFTSLNQDQKDSLYNVIPENMRHEIRTLARDVRDEVNRRNGSITGINFIDAVLKCLISLCRHVQRFFQSNNEINNIIAQGLEDFRDNALAPAGLNIGQGANQNRETLAKISHAAKVAQERDNSPEFQMNRL